MKCSPLPDKLDCFVVLMIRQRKRIKSRSCSNSTFHAPSRFFLRKTSDESGSAPSSMRRSSFDRPFAQFSARVCRPLGLCGWRGRIVVSPSTLPSLAESHCSHHGSAWTPLASPVFWILVVGRGTQRREASAPVLAPASDTTADRDVRTNSKLGLGVWRACL